MFKISMSKNLFKKLYPTLNILVDESSPNLLKIIDSRSNSQYRLEGTVAIEVIKCLETGTFTPKLSLLTKNQPLYQTLLELHQAESTPLTLESAIRLTGFNTLFIELTGTCNERCLHCYAGSGPDIKESLSREQCHAVLDDAESLNFSRIQFTGGDPLICSFLPELVERVSQMQNKPHCEIYTNGLILNDTLLDKLSPFKPSFAFSYYASTPEIHDSITRVPGSQQKTEAAIKRCLVRNLDVRTSIVVMEENKDSLEETIKSLKKIGVPHVSSSRSYSVGRGDHFEGKIERETSDHRFELTDGGNTQATESSKEKESKQRAIKQKDGKLCISYEGKVLPCIFNRDDILGDLNEQSLKEIFKTSAPLNKSKNAICQSSCENSLQCTGCRITWHSLRALEGENCE